MDARTGALIAASESLSRRTMVIGIGFGGLAAALSAAGWRVKVQAQDATPPAAPVQQPNAVVVTFGHPTDIAAFEDYYLNSHRPQALQLPGIREGVFHSNLITPESEPADTYRIATLIWDSPSDLLEVLSSTEGQDIVADVADFATGGFTAMLAHVELASDLPTFSATPAM